MFPAQVYSERRKVLKDRLQSGLALLLGNDESPMNYPDNPFAFRQDSSFLYYFGLDQPGLAAVVDLDEDREILFGADRTVEEVVWMGPDEPLSEKARKVGVEETAPPDRLSSLLDKALEQGRNVRFLPQYRPENVLKIHELLGIDPAAVGQRVSEELIRAVVAQRSLKAPEEIEQIRAAVGICAEMQTTAMRMTRPGMYEREVAGVMEGIAQARAGRLSFPTIFSVRGETLHNHDHGNVMQSGHMALNDSGAETALHYAADITRTFPVGGEFTSQQKEVYGIVLQAHNAALDAVKPGVEFRGVHLLAGRILASGLKDLGLMTGDVDQAVQAGAHALFFQCGLGHMMGLDVHDMEGLGEDYVGYTETIRRSGQFGLRSLRLGKALEPRFVITVEPGLYFIPQLIDQWRAEGKHTAFINYDAVEKFKGFGGIRIEDDVLVTANGKQVLSSMIPKTIEDVEATCSR